MSILFPCLYFFLIFLSKEIEILIKKMFFSFPITSINLSDGAEFATLELLKVGEFDSESHGKFSITTEQLIQAKENFDKNVFRLTDQDGKPQLPLNFAHDKGREAAGWIKELELNDEKTVLIGKIKLTPVGREKVENKEFAFASAEFSFEHHDPELKRKTNNVLTGAALTNIPFMRGLKSIQLTEFNMEEILKLIMTLTDEEKVILLEKLKSMVTPDPINNPNDQNRVFSDKNKEPSKKVIELTEKVEEIKKELKFTELLAENKVVPAQKEAYLKGDIEGMIDKAPEKSLSFSQQSSSKGSGKDDNKDKKEKIDTKEKAEDKIIELANKICKEDKSITFSTASSTVLKENKNLSDLYEGINL